MHNTMLLLLFVLFVDGVSGADPDETVSVIEGDSVTLHTGLTEILNDDTILWKFGPKGSFISQITRKANFTSLGYTDVVRFKGRLQVDQNTGSLTIRNTRDRHSEQYQVTISRGRTMLPSKTFNVTVQRVVIGTDGVKSKSVSVMEAGSVTLNPNKTQIQGDALMLWRFVDKGIILAKIDVETKETSLNDADEGFRGRLQLDQTGSLTITNTRTTDSGLYHLQTRGSESLQQFVLTVNQPVLSPGAKAGIAVGVVFAAAAAVVGFIYHRRKMSELRKQTLTVTVKEGEDVTLKPNKAIKKDDYILWLFGDEELQTSIAEINVKTEKIFTHDYVADGIFRDRLYLDTTGSLTIRNSRIAHSGHYTLQIISSGGASEQRFILTVKENMEEKSVIDGGSVTLDSDTEIQRDDQILWMFGDQEDLIAEIRGETVKIYDDAAGVRFRDRLELNKTGSLTITNTEAEHAGLYKLQIIISRRILFKKFRVFIPLRHVKVTVGESVHLSTDLTKMERDDEIQWRFGDDSLIAEIKGGTRAPYYVPDERFRDGLQLNTHTGDLTIKNSTAEHAGCYKLKIHSSEGNTNRTYIVTRARGKSMTKGKNDYIKPVSESEMRLLLNKQVPDGVNEEERKSSV